MNKHKLLVIGLISSVLFNGLVIVILSNNGNSSHWIFPEIGPAIMQDSYQNRAPVLESPFGIIGDIPGGYSIYSGGALVDNTNHISNVTIRLEMPSNLSTWQIDVNALIAAFLFAIVPLLIIVILGRRSYGSSKTY